jgi:hypothetical protein
MFAVTDRGWSHNCQGIHRREFLRIGSLALGGLTLPGMLAAKANAAARNVVRDKSVVLLFLQCGPSHIEFFDPKMTAPVEFRSITGEVKTRLPGVTFGGTFPRMAALTDKLAVVRSYGSRNNDHTYLSVASGGNRLKAAMSAIYARVAGANHPVTGMPSNTLVLPEAVRDGLKLDGNFETGALPTLTATGQLGPACEAFNPSGGGELKSNLELRITPERFQDRRSLLSKLDQVRRQLDATGATTGASLFQQQAFDVIARGVADAFDLSKEDPATLARYDTSHLFRMEELQRFYDMRRVTNLLGRQMLLARRLCEAGCGFVTVSDCGWDMHANSNSPKQMAGIWPMGRQVDHAVAAFVEDIYERGLQDKILLIVTGEMGRTPRINNNGGRDHYGDLTSLVFAGGGLRMGQVIGQSDAQAAKPVAKEYGPENLVATVMHSLFDISQLRLQSDLPRELVRLTEDQPIAELF